MTSFFHALIQWIQAHYRFLVGLLIGSWLVLCVALVLMIHHAGTRDNAQSSDVIIVLGAGIRRDGEANYALRRRSQRAAALWQQGIAPHVICTGGTAPGYPRSEAEACRDVLIREGVPRDVIYLESRSRSTEENALYSREIMQRENWSAAVVVSDSYHVFRARILFTTRGINVHMSPVPRDRIRGVPSYPYSVVREVLALHWQFLKDALGLPITHL